MANKRIAIMLTLTVAVALIYFAIPRQNKDTNNPSKTGGSGNVTEIGGAEFEKSVLQSKGAVLVDFWAPWCGPCRQMAPIVDGIADENAGKLSVYKVNVDDNQPLAREYGIDSIPTLIVFKDGKMVDKQVGLPSQEEVVQWVKNTAGI